jgi:uncharacterized Ntn-hydrolase superfamily protein
MLVLVFAAWANPSSSRISPIAPGPPTSDDCLDLRVDDHPEPLVTLQRLYRLIQRKS